MPEELFNYPKALDEKPRWCWNGQDLVEDGTFELRRRHEFEKWFLIDVMMGWYTLRSDSPESRYSATRNPDPGTTRCSPRGARTVRPAEATESDDRVGLLGALATVEYGSSPVPCGNQPRGSASQRMSGGAFSLPVR